MDVSNSKKSLWFSNNFFYKYFCSCWALRWFQSFDSRISNVIVSQIDEQIKPKDYHMIVTYISIIKGKDSINLHINLDRQAWSTGRWIFWTFLPVAESQRSFIVDYDQQVAEKLFLEPEHPGILLFLPLKSWSSLIRSS